MFIQTACSSWGQFSLVVWGPDGEGLRAGKKKSKGSLESSREWKWRRNTGLVNTGDVCLDAQILINNIF